MKIIGIINKKFFQNYFLLINSILYNINYLLTFFILELKKKVLYLMKMILIN